MDESTVEFSQSESKTVTLIHGENGAGKTALLNAILWCTTGKTTPRLKSPKNLQYESDELGGKSDECYVTLTFEHENRSWLAKRMLRGKDEDFQLGQKGTSGTYSFESGSMAQKHMNLILPPEMATYFFFDGEGFNQGQTHSDRSFASSVKNILGFEFANQTIDKIDEVKQKVSAEISKINQRAHKNEKAASEYKSASDSLVKAEGRVKELEKIINSSQDSMDEAKAKMDSFGHEAIQERQRAIDENALELNQKVAEKNAAEQGLKGLVRSYAALTFSLDLATEGRQVLKARRKAGQYPAKFQRPMILELLELGECICGSELSEKQRKTLELKLDEAGTEVEADRISLADTKASLNLNQFAEFRHEHDTFSSIIQDRTTEITALQVEIDRLEMEQKEFDEADFNIFKKKYDNEKHTRDSAQMKMVKARDDINYYKNAVNKFKPKTIPAGDVARLERLERFVSGLERVKESAERYLAKTVDTTANHIAALMRHDLRRTDISHKISVDKASLKFAYVDSNGNEVGESTGEELFLNLSFASALSKIAAIRSKIENGILVPGAVGPLVVDAPFGDLDPTNARIIYEVLRESTDQLVLLLSKSHWEPLDDVMRPSLGNEYLLIRQHAQSADDEQETKSIDIEGKTYGLVSHDFDYPTTMVERVK